jgi:hypothetical protein
MTEKQTAWRQEISDVALETPGEFASILKNLDPAWILKALAATGKASMRRRKLPAEQVVWLVLGMALFRDQSIAMLVDLLDIALPSGGRPSVVQSAIPWARARLGPEPLRWLFEQTARVWSTKLAELYAWRGLKVYAMDGTTFRLDDSKANRDHFGSAKTTKMCAYPQGRAVVLIAAHARMTVAAKFGPYATGEQTLGAELWNDVPESSVVIVDRAFNSVDRLLRLSGQSNRHWLLRAKSSTKWTVIEQYGPDEMIVDMKVSNKAREANKELPKTYRVRVIAYQKKGFTRQHLLTSMLNRSDFPSGSIVELYHSRWEVENAFDEIKTEMLNREECLRSKTPNGVLQEFWGILLAHNLIRLEMARVAQEANLEPTRISFVAAASLITKQWASCGTASPGAIPKHLIKLRENISRFILPPRRSGRHYPRVVKSRDTKYPVKQSAIPLPAN